MPLLLDDNELLAKLLTSIKIANSGYTRTLSPIQVSELISRLVSESGIQIALSVLPIKKDMLESFLRLTLLPEECKDAIFWGESGEMGVGFTAASEIAKLKKKEDILYLFASSMEKEITKDEVKEIISFSKQKNISFKEAAEKTIGAREQLIVNHMIVFEISESAKTLLSSLSQNAGLSENELFKNKIIEKFEISVKAVSIRGERIGLVLDKDDYNNFKNKVNTLKVTYDSLSDYVLK